jgi:hypothetical protein
MRFRDQHHRLQGHNRRLDVLDGAGGPRGDCSFTLRVIPLARSR